MASDRRVAIGDTIGGLRLLSIDPGPSVDPYHRDTDELTTTALVLDPMDRSVYVMQDMDMGGHPAGRWYGLIITVPVDGYPSTDEWLRVLAEPQVEVLISQIVGGYETSRDDSGNLCGRLSPVAIVALDVLTAHLDAIRPLESESRMFGTADSYLSDVQEEFAQLAHAWCEALGSECLRDLAEYIVTTVAADDMIITDGTPGMLAELERLADAAADDRV